MQNIRGNNQEGTEVAKVKERSELEHLRSTIKTQRSQIKNLKKEVERARKRSYAYNDFEERLADQMIEEEQKETELPTTIQKCPDCGNKAEVIELGARIMIVCECGHRKTKKV